MRRAFWTSKSGWVFAVLYLGPAAVCIYRAVTCTGFLCEIPAIYAALPSSLAYWTVGRWLDRIYVFDSGVFDLGSPLNLFLLIPAVTTNAAMCYWVGRYAGKLEGKYARK